MGPTGGAGQSRAVRLAHFPLERWLAEEDGEGSAAELLSLAEYWASGEQEEAFRQGWGIQKECDGILRHWSGGGLRPSRGYSRESSRPRWRVGCRWATPRSSAGCRSDGRGAKPGWRRRDGRNASHNWRRKTDGAWYNCCWRSQSGWAMKRRGGPAREWRT